MTIKEAPTLTWGDIQILSIRKMFLNSGNVTKNDLPSMRADNNKLYNIYLNAMPAVCNEGINIIIQSGYKIYDRIELTDENISDVQIADDKDLVIIDLRTIDEEFHRVNSILVNNRIYNDYNIKAGRYLYLNKNIVENNSVSVIYEIFPFIDINEDITEDDKVINMPYEAAILLPLFIASELYKDDDLTLSTVYRNQFEAELERLTTPDDDDAFVDVHGWV